MEKLKERITENGIDSILVGDYYIPDLKLPEERLDLIIEQMKAAKGVTEERKAQNQLEWVGRMDDRKLNVYNGRGAFKKSPPQILLQGNWLEQVGFRGIMLMAK